MSSVSSNRALAGGGHASGDWVCERVSGAPLDQNSISDWVLTTAHSSGNVWNVNTDTQRGLATH